MENPPTPDEIPRVSPSADVPSDSISDDWPQHTARGRIMQRRRQFLRKELARLAGQKKTSWRGWIHVGAFPAAVVGGLAAVILGPTVLERLGAAIFALTGMLLFGTSAVYHRGPWRMRIRLLLRRFDHANIFLIIAGTYTPLALLLLPGRDAAILLSIMWVGAIAGVTFRMVWTSAPRWLFVPVYVGIGVAGVGYVPHMWAENLAAGILIVIGGAFYIVGAVIYGLKRPNPVPTIFGFHELFHTCTVVGYGCHLAAVLTASVMAM